jgi:serine/threonine protein kinase
VVYADDKMYIVLEYMNQNLERFIYSYEENEIPLGLIRKILKQIISGLAALNDSQVIHRDLKPQNILINYNPLTTELQVKIADFGLARTYSYFTKRLSKEVGNFF